MNRLRLEGDQNRIDELLKSVKGKDSVLDFNRIIPMPESLNIEAGSRTDNGLRKRIRILCTSTPLPESRRKTC